MLTIEWSLLKIFTDTSSKMLFSNFLDLWLCQHHLEYPVSSFAKLMDGTLSQLKGMVSGSAGLGVSFGIGRLLFQPLQPDCNHH